MAATRYKPARLVIAAALALSVISGTAYFANNPYATSAADTPQSVPSTAGTAATAPASVPSTPGTVASAPTAATTTSAPRQAATARRSRGS